MTVTGTTRTSVFSPSTDLLVSVVGYCYRSTVKVPLVTGEVVCLVHSDLGTFYDTQVKLCETVPKSFCIFCFVGFARLAGRSCYFTSNLRAKLTALQCRHLSYRYESGADHLI